MRLGPKERTILSAIQFRADAAVSDIARLTRLPSHTIHYYLNRFREEQIIRPALFTNVYALGYAQYEIYFSLAALDAPPRQKLMKLLEQTENVVWLAELGGRFQYAMTVCARSLEELAEFLDRIAAKHGAILQEKEFAAIVGFHLFRKKYLAPQKVPLDELSFGGFERQVSLDETDMRILAAFYQPGAESSSAVARSTGIPRTTVEFRLKKMTRCGFIKGHIYTISAHKLGMQVYKMLVTVKGLPHGIKTRIHDFCLRHPHIVNLIDCLGGWDYEMTVEVPSPETIVEVSQSFSAACGSKVNRIEILPVFRHTLVRNFVRSSAPVKEKRL